MTMLPHAYQLATRGVPAHDMRPSSALTISRGRSLPIRPGGQAGPSRRRCEVRRRVWGKVRSPLFPLAAAYCKGGGSRTNGIL